MEERKRSGESSGVVVKSRNSSGCLIIRKKGDGMGKVGSSGSRKEKRKPRLTFSDSGSSDELLEPHLKKRGSRTDHGYSDFDNVDDMEFGRKRVGIEQFDYMSNGDVPQRSNMSRLDVFEFDEYDRFDENKRLKKEYMDDDGMREFEAEPSGGGDIVYKRRNSYFHSSSGLVDERNAGIDYSVNGNRFERKRDRTQEHALLRDKFNDTSEKPIRLQGKNGVLKVMVNKNKGSGVLKTYDHWEAEDYRKGSRAEDIVKRNQSLHSSFPSEKKRRDQAGSVGRTEKNLPILQKSLPTKTRKTYDDSESDDSDTSLKLESRKTESHKSLKLGKSIEEKTPPSEKLEGKVKRGSGTEKQKLREHIRGMLLEAGWTIDYRPRRNRDYQDAVYVNPSGTAYWSIIKAYDALQKQFDEEKNNPEPVGESSCFTPISENVLSKLTRQTKKKMEKEMKRKYKNAGGSRDSYETAAKRSGKVKCPADSIASDEDEDEDKLSSFIKPGAKLLKSRTFENLKSESQISLHEDNDVNGDGDNVSLQGRKSKKLRRCTLLVRTTNKGLMSEGDGYTPYTGKRTLLSWLIDSGTVQLSEKVQYMNRRRTRIVQQGWITRDGIHCVCCSKIVTVSKFEIHAGSKLRQPFQYIYLESGTSLLQCLLDAWNKQEDSEFRSYHHVAVNGDDPNDDTCGLCGDGGDLICCDGCPSTFHQSCLGIQMLPAGDWNCPNCICQFCRMANDTAAEPNAITDSALLTCNLCERKYHQSCMKEDAYAFDSSSSFCGKKCKELSENLQNFIGVKHDLEAGLSWSLIHRTDTDSDISLRVLPQRVECNSKIAVALAVMDECFLPIVDRRSGVNLIRNVLYSCGSNFNRLNYSGFYTAVLERGDEIIAAASLRFHGPQLAEMPFVGTRHIYRRQGMFRRLFCAIESALCSFKVKKLVIPAISELMNTWTKVFGFDHLEESGRKELRYMNMLVFPGIDMLQKLLVGHENTDSVASGTGVILREPKRMDCSMADEDSYSGHDNISPRDDAGVSDMSEANDKVAASDVIFQAPDALMKNASLPSSPSDSPNEDKLPDASEENTPSNSESGEKVPDATEPSCLPYDSNPPVPQMEDKLTSDSPIDNKIISSGDDTDVLNGSNDGSCVDLHSSLVTSDETTMQVETNLDQLKACEMEGKTLATSEGPSDLTNSKETEAEVENQSQAGGCSEEAAVLEPVLCPEEETSAHISIEERDEIKNPPPLSSYGADDSTVQSNSFVNDHNACESKTEELVAPQLTFDAPNYNETNRVVSCKFLGADENERNQNLLPCD